MFPQHRRKAIEDLLNNSYQLICGLPSVSTLPAKTTESGLNIKPLKRFVNEEY